MELSDKKLNTFQKGIWQKIFSLAVYGVCIVAGTYAIAFLIKNDILKALTAIQKSADLSEHTLRMLTAALDERGFALASIIIFCSVILALVSWFIIRWAGNRNWSTTVILPKAVEFRSAMDRLGVLNPRDRFDIIEKFRIPLYITEKPLLEPENENVQARHYRHGAQADMRSLAMLETFIGCQKLCLDAGDFDFLASEYKRTFGTVNSSALASLKDQNDKLNEEKLVLQEDLDKAQKTIEEMKKKLAGRGEKKQTSDQAVLLAPMTAGDKGKIVSANNELKFCIVEFTDASINELLGEARDHALPQLEMSVRRPGRKSAAGEFVTRIKLRQWVKGKNLVIADILADWEQAPSEKNDVVFL